MHIWKTDGQELLTLDSGYEKNSSIKEDQFIKGVYVENEDDFLSDNKLMHYVEHEMVRELDSFSHCDDSGTLVVIMRF